ncbi:T9SS type A sorting domain-containing protein [Fulvivirga sediminis]|uniref:T9SS type A sorting domain-containing protein n=1 Tax=Fulvivirga sediminis TaxID=2803949 RepID=A0A937K056_9BACT|nr:T9SS type A sorting domain-containing protein [Fulvivirga sediminis]MBL3658028.1 T9SS type A sorting domain-containing protein [Fulvivirga sediminis]
MNNVIATLLCFMICDCAFAQFQRSFGTSVPEEGLSLTSLNERDSKYLFAGYSERLLFGESDAYLTKTTLSGSQMWTYVYGGDRQDYFTSVRTTSFLQDELTYVAAGQTYSFGAGGGDAWIVGTRRDGQPVFSMVYGREGEDIFYDVKNSFKRKLDSDGYIAVGSTDSYSEFFPGDNLYVVKTDVFGNLQRAVVIGARGNQVGSWIEQTRDGGYIITGYTTNYECSYSPLFKGSQDIYVLKLREDLTMQWAQAFGFSGGKSPVRGMNAGTCVKETEEGSFVVTGFTNSFGLDNTYDAFLMLLDPRGGFQLMKTYGTECENEMAYSLSVGPNADGRESITVLGTNYSVTSPTYEAMMFQTDLALNLLWAKEYGERGDDLGYELTKYNQRWFAFVGYTYSFGAGNSDAYLVETSLSGKTETGCEREIGLKQVYHQPCNVRVGKPVFVDEYKRSDLAFERYQFEEDGCDLRSGSVTMEEEIGSVNVYPNPSEDYVIVEVPLSSIVSEIKMSKMNNGEAVMVDYESADSKHLRLDTSGLDKGIYILEITTKEGEKIKARIVKE